MLIKLAVSGDKGSFSEEAGLQYAEDNDLDDYQIIYAIDAQGVVDALEKYEAEIGILPVHNTIGGDVGMTREVLETHNNIEIIETGIELSIMFTLVTRAQTKKEEIQKIVSHIQVLKQCAEYVKREFPQVIIEEYRDSAQAVRDLVSGKLTKDVAVLAPHAAVLLYKDDLNIIDTQIRDREDNYTSFIAMKLKI